MKKPHITNLKTKLKTFLSHAKEYAEGKYTFRDEFGEEGRYLILSREFQAGLNLIDTLVLDDQFTTLLALTASRNALLRYREMLREDGKDLQDMQITAFLHEISAVEGSAFR